MVIFFRDSIGFVTSKTVFCQNDNATIREKCPYSEFFWSAVFSISPYSVRMRENTKKKKKMWEKVEIQRLFTSADREKSDQGRLNSNYKMIHLPNLAKLFVSSISLLFALPTGFLFIVSGQSFCKFWFLNFGNWEQNCWKNNHEEIIF